MGKNSYKMLLFIMYGSAFLAGFGENMMNMGLMDIISDFSIDSITAQWLVTGYMIVSTVAVVCMAYLYCRFKLRALFYTGALLSIAGSALGLVAGNFAALMAARLVQGVGLGMFIPMMMNTVLQVAPKNRLGTYMSVGGCMISFGPALAPVVCGALVTAFGWHSSFLVTLLGMAVLALLGIVSVQNLQNSPSHLDAASVVLATLFLFCLSFGLAQLTAAPAAGLASLAGAAVFGVVFVVRQGKVEHPLIDLTPMRRASFWPATILVFIAMLTTFSLSVLLPLYFEGALGMAALHAGLVILVPVVVNSATTLLAGKIMDRHGEWPLLPVGFLLILAGTLAMSLVAQGMQVWPMFAASVVTFAGVGLVFSASQTAGLRTLPLHMNPFGVAILTTCTQIAACVGPSLFVGIMSGAEHGALATGSTVEAAAADGFACAILVASAISAVGLLTATPFSRAAFRRSASHKGKEDSVR